LSQQFVGRDNESVSAIGKEQEHNAGYYYPTLRQTAVLILLNHMNGRYVVRAASDLQFVAFNALRCVQTQIFGVRPHKADCIGAAWQRLKSILLERFKVIATNLQDPGNRREIIATPQPCRAQILTDRLQGRFEIVRDLAQMNPPILGTRSVVDGESRDLCHRRSRCTSSGAMNLRRSSTFYRLSYPRRLPLNVARSALV
jgi:hypothetical protein